MDAQTVIGAGVSGVCIAVAEKMEFLTHNLLHITMPTIVMQAAQAFAWIAGGAAGVVTVISWYEKRRTKK